MTLSEIIGRHCERSEAIHVGREVMDCFVALSGSSQ
jgi:hypothetical protein